LKRFFEQLSLILTFAGIAQGIFVVLLLNNKGVTRSRANLFLSILLIALSFSIAHILFAGAVINHLSAKVYTLGDPTYFLIAPLLWFYTQELTGQKVRISSNIIFHFLPFLLIIILSLSLRSVNSENPLIQFLDHHNKLIHIVFWIIVVVQFSGYLYVIRRKWIVYRELIRNEVSNKENVDISWISFIMVVFLLINLFFLFNLFVVIHFKNNAWLAKTTALIFSLSVFALGYKGILQKEIFKNDAGLIPRPVNGALSQTVTSKPDQELIKRLLDHMQEKKSYLDPELTLSQLAKDLDIGRSQLSQLINDGIGDNFYDFINKYRVEQVKQLMTDPRVKHFSMLGIALEAGFKSKSTFNLIFKRFTGLTPTEYRKNLGQ
jgi:AraC-like DNA-binding protein